MITDFIYISKNQCSQFRFQRESRPSSSRKGMSDHTILFIQFKVGFRKQGAREEGPQIIDFIFLSLQKQPTKSSI